MDISIPKKLAPIYMFLILMLLGLAFRQMKDVQYLVDETNHVHQIDQFLQGDLHPDPMISTLPGYHMVVAGIASLLGVGSVAGLRLINLGLSLLSGLVFYWLTACIYGEYQPLKLFLYIFFPLLFPLFFLVYTDTFSLLLVLLGFGLVSTKKYNAGALAGLLSLAVRQNNIVWVGLMFLYAYQDLYGPRLKPASRSLKQLAMFYITFIAFGFFIVLNRGIAVGDTAMHPAFTLHTGNVYFILFLFFLLFLPLNIYNARPIYSLLRSKPWILLLILPAYGFFLLTFKNDHPYNLINTGYFLRNIVLVKATSSLAWKTLFFLSVAYSLFSLAVTALNSKRSYLLYPFTLLYLLPAWLVEPRYTLVPFVLFILYKKEQPAWLEVTTLGLWMAACYLLLVVTSQVEYFI